MSDETTEKAASGFSWGIWILWGLFLVLVVYPLSVGPIILLENKYPPIIAAIEPALEVTYAPIVYLYENSELVRDFYGWYLELWGFDIVF